MAPRSVLVLAVILAVICIAFGHPTPGDSAEQLETRNEAVFRNKRQWGPDFTTNNCGPVPVGPIGHGYYRGPGNGHVYFRGSLNAPSQFPFPTYNVPQNTYRGHHVF